LSWTHLFVQKLTKNALVGLMTSWFGLVKLLSYNVESDLGYVGSIVLYGITEILLKVTFSTNKTDYHGLTEILLKVAFKANNIYHQGIYEIRDCRDHDRMVVGFITTYAIIANHHCAIR